ncbi:hypothetical protein C7974DRAFT_393474 [Boeremia exigua]|uniref:uncharacterized protein n=1 Tax=Boeremia exigua TaxID=749465 RepID=UPI001E8DBC18|nr:uncharacterized protein C7974DRAFT_393474 [Boeremia exigua]KAH6633789.1 hypothetical protein C7974DRAFT_393474 [Boeremia exigua]
MDNLTENESVEDFDFVALSALLLTDPAVTPADFQHPNQNLNSCPSTSSAFPFNNPATNYATPSKKGARINKGAIYILKAWLNTHEDRPYPRPDDLQLLQQQTGLERKQITNWFANARRRGLVRDSEPKHLQGHNGQTSPLDIIARPGTPAYKDPLQRWVESPPENEAASFGDIIRAVTTDLDRFNGEHDQPETLYPSSSASSVSTSYSNARSDPNSSGSQTSHGPIRRSRKRGLKKRDRYKRALAAPDLPYQCTFCVETFKTKYDWQRHEKALHLSLEQWICAPEGARVPVSAKQEDQCCAFCGEPSPDDTHLDGHQYSACQARDETERSFYRKDHLVQHLRLVHKVDTKHVPLDRWKTSMLDIQSRCGFCNLIMSTWTERVNHLGEHFKTGATMAKWQGDWGFEDHVLQRVEDGMPPYFIHLEKMTPWPLRACDTPTATPVSAYELLKLEVNFFRQGYLDLNGIPPDRHAIQLEACRIIFASDALSDTGPSTSQRNDGQSWLRDIIMLNPDITTEALFGPLRTPSEGVLSLRICGLNHLFERCPLETQLRAFAQAQGNTPSGWLDWTLQKEACEIIRRTENTPNATLEGFADWLIHAIGANNSWLPAFKLRTGLRSDDQPDSAATFPAQPINGQGLPAPFLMEPTFISGLVEAPFHTIAQSPSPLALTPGLLVNNSQSYLAMGTKFYRLFSDDLRRWVLATMSPSNPGCHVPSDAEIQHHARWIMYESDDPWNQTVADQPEWLRRFKKGVGIIGAEGSTKTTGLLM